MATRRLLLKCLEVVSTCILLFNLSHVDSMTMEREILDAAIDPQMFDFYHVMPEGDVKVMTELDLLLTLDQYKKLYSNSSRVKRKAISNITTLWTNCIVYYEISSSLNTQDSQVIKEAIDEWEKYTCLDFKISSTSPSRIQFRDGAGCYSQLGKQNSPQPISLARGCRTKWVVAHEIGHAIGWIHEHMRPDRDQFIRINWNVIPERFQENFKKYSHNDIDHYNVPYDYESVMHYGATALPNSITTLDPEYQNKIGQRNGFSFKDIKLANLMYNCSMNCQQQKQTCPHNGFVLFKSFKNKNACQCWCDSGNILDPLVLCSDIDKEQPPPIPIEPTQEPSPQCLDVRKDCTKLKSEGKCMSQMEAMMDVCASTCGFCGKGDNLCMDHEKGCRIMAAAGMCKDEGLLDIMKKLCPASCGHCEDISDPCAIQQEMMDLPNSGSYYISSFYSFHFLTFGFIFRFL